MGLIKKCQIFTIPDEYYLYLGQELLLLCSEEVYIIPNTNSPILSWEQISGDHVGMIPDEDQVNLTLEIGPKLGTYIFKATVPFQREVYDYITVKTRPTDYPINIEMIDNSMIWEIINNVKIKYVLKQYDEKGFIIEPPFILKVLFSDVGWEPEVFIFDSFLIMNYNPDTNEFIEESTIEPFINYYVTPNVEPYYIQTDANFFLFGRYKAGNKIYYTRGPRLNLNKTVQIDTYDEAIFKDTLYMEARRIRFFTSQSYYEDLYKNVPYKQSYFNYESNRIEYKVSSYTYDSLIKQTPQKDSSYQEGRRDIFGSIVIG